VRSIVWERFVFVEECSTNISLSPIFARAPKGQRAHGKAPRNWGENVWLICAIDAGGVKPSMSVEGAVDSRAFEIYIEHLLAPKLKRGQIVVMENLCVCTRASAWSGSLSEPGANCFSYRPTRRT
jgi:hypothetical protein